ncbi:PLP-dependent aminotransferase family protein [Pendulispora rubella]|uniref:PLP-dependent aminotransferase family protein n=1 Tax=Pendulispora rubella TaxID=2741070 RepID=A0ABZ2KSB1_9BACT
MPRRAPEILLALPPRARSETLAEWVYGGLRDAILDGRLRRGGRVPATRDLAARYELSRGVVVAAYDRLHDEGYLVSRRGSGTVVNERVFEDYQVVPRHGAEEPARPPPPKRLRARPFCPIEPAVSEFPMAVWARLSARSARNLPARELSRGDPAGSRALRESIAAYLGTARGVTCRAEQIVIVSGAQQALDLVARTVIRPGDGVWMEDPGYRAGVDAFRNAGARIVPVRVDDRGLDPADGRRRCPQPRAVYLTPAHQFYLGVALSLERRLELIAWARQHHIALVEDDYDSEFRYRGRPLPALAGLAGADTVFLIGTFNKVLFPSLRCGYMVVPDRWHDRILALRYQTDLYPPSLLQATLRAFLDEGHFARHLRRMRELYAARRGAIEAAIARHLDGLLRVPEIHAGLSTPAYLLDGRTSQQAEALALEHGLDVWALDRYALRRRDLRGLVLGFAAFTEHQLQNAVITLARALG